MQSVAGIAKNKEKEAARILGQKQTFLQQQRQRLQELDGYRLEYAKKFQNAGNQGFNAQQLNEYRVFLDKLNQAIVQQSDLINKAETDFLTCQKSWILSRTNSKALENMVERCKNEEFQVQAQKEQKELDERAMRLGLKFFDDN